MRAILLVTVMLVAPASAEKLYTQESGKPHVKCPTASWCVFEFDFTYMVASNAAKKHFMADYGSADAPLVKGTTSKDEVNKRAVTALTEILTKQLKAKTAKVDCAVASRLPALLGLGETLDVPLPAKKSTPLAKVAAKDVNAAWLKAASKLDRDAPTNDLFTAADLAKMTGTTFAKPTLVRAGQWRSGKTCQGAKCTEEIVTEVAFYVLYSPESADAYILDASLGHKTIALHTKTMCGTGMLPNNGWFDWKP